jgi:hypothetical protein
MSAGGAAEDDMQGSCKRAGQASKRTGEWLRNVVGITDPDKPFSGLRHSAITGLRVARTASGEIAVKRYARALSHRARQKGRARGYGKHPAKDLNTAIEWVRNPLVD